MVCVDMLVSTRKTLETVDGEMDGKPLEKTKVNIKTAAKEKPTDSTQRIRPTVWRTSKST